MSPMVADGVSDESSAAGEINIAKLSLFARRATVHAAATIINAMVLALMLLPTAPRVWLGTWALGQVCIAALLLLRARRAPRRPPRGTPRGIQRAAWFCTASGCLLGSVVWLLGGASEVVRLLVLLTLAATASAASTTLAPIPRAAQGYIAGALLLPAARWMLQGDLDYVVIALLAVSMALFLVYSARITHDAFLESLGRARQIEALSAQFRAERGEWLDLSHATEAFVLLDPNDAVLLWNGRFQELVQPASVARGLDYIAILSASALVPQSVGGKAVTRDEWVSMRRELLDRPGEQLESYAGDVFYQCSTQALPSRRKVVTAVNVTALKRTERTLREQDHAFAQAQRQESVGVIAGGVAHDFNNLLTVIRSATELLTADRSDASSRELLDDIVAAVERGARLTRQLLAYGRLTTLSPRSLDLNGELLKSLPMFRRLLPASVQIETDLADRLGLVFADPEQLAQVIMNLVLNARDAMPRGGVLRLCTANVGGTHVALCVADNGTGMAPETAERIFEPFFSTKDQQRGSGLGLSAVQGIVRQSGGTIQVETGLGVGTTMRVCLPYSEKVGLSGPVSRSSEALAQGNAEWLLVVDDHTPVRDMTARLLRRHGYAVTEAAGPFAALEQLERHRGRFWLLVTDVVMPDMSGVELAAAARRLNRDLPVLFMSGYEPGLFARADAPDVLQKPFTPDQLLRAVGRALPRARRGGLVG
jgi:signal transduction histidine kinase/CheY-like chemotaxis protein